MEQVGIRLGQPPCLFGKGVRRGEIPRAGVERPGPVDGLDDTPGLQKDPLAFFGVKHKALEPCRLKRWGFVPSFFRFAQAGFKNA